LYHISKSGIPTVISQTALAGHFTRIVAAKLTGDSRDDFVGLDSAAGVVGEFVRLGSGFTPAGTIQVSGATDLFAADLDGSGGVDFLLTNPGDGVIDVLSGGLNATSATPYRASAQPIGVAQP